MQLGGCAFALENFLRSQVQHKGFEAGRVLAQFVNVMIAYDLVQVWHMLDAAITLGTLF